MKTIALIVSLLLTTPLCQGQSLTNDSPQKIKVLSWNIFMLPGFLSTSKAKRAKVIGKMLANSDYDVIVFQEAFCPLARKRITQQLDSAYAYQAGPANRRWVSMKTNSGIWIFSRYPITYFKSIAFHNRFGADALSRKGALLVELDVHGKKIQVTGTHLQNSGDPWIKHAQCVELYERLIKPNQKEGVPQIVCGDFNISRNRSEESYRFMLTSLDATDGQLDGKHQYTYNREQNDLHVENGSANDLIDYVLMRDNGAWVQCVTRQIRVLRKRWANAHEDLSDHYSMEAEFNFTNAPAMLTAR